MTDRPTNILFICSDQEVNHLDLPSELDLPGHDRLRTRGTTFTNYHVTTGPCTPSRAVIYSGQHSSATGVISNTDAPPFRELPTEIATLGHMLRDHGYYTAYKGKWHLGGAELPEFKHPLLWPSTEDALEPYGFSDYTVEGDNWGRAWQGFGWDRSIAADSAAWLRERGTALNDDGQPWCLAVNFVNPHDVMFYLADEGQPARRVHPNFGAPLRSHPAVPPYDKFWDVDLPASLSDDLSDKPWCTRNFQKMWNHLLGGPEPDQHEAWRQLRSYYFNCIRDVDAQLQIVLDALEASGQADRTAIVYTSDHGELGGAHGLREKGATMFKENLRVPFIVSHPDHRGGDETSALGSAMDVVPTVLALAGVEQSTLADRYPALKGTDILPAVGGLSTHRDSTGILVYYGVMLGSFDADLFRDLVAKMFATGAPPPPPGDGPVQPLGDRALFRGIITDRYKFARYFAPAEHHTPLDWESLTAHNDLELYDLEADPDEVTNLAAAPDNQRQTIINLNNRLNALIAAEIGVDDGHELPGKPEHYRLGG